MLRPTVSWRRMINHFAVGSKGQKHQAFVPTPFLYRFTLPGNAPGPVLMKYFHLHGRFPSGLETPLRLEEFQQGYLRDHVPLEVEEWLRCFVRDPVETICVNVDTAIAALESVPRAAPTLHTRAVPVQAGSASESYAPLQLAMREVGVEVPAVAIRFAVQRPALRTALIGALEDWSDAVRTSGGSTCHRRAALRQMLKDTTEDANGWEQQRLSSPDRSAARTSSSPGTTGDTALTAAGATSVAAALSVPVHETAADERAVLSAVTVLAQASQREGRYDLAERLLRDGLRLAHDEDVEGATRANYAAALNGAGDYGRAEAEAREAVVLSRKPAAFASLAVALAYQEEPLEAAMAVVESGLAEHPGDPQLLQTAEALVRGLAGREAVPAAARGRRFQSMHDVRAKHATAPPRTFAAPTWASGKPVAERIDGSRGAVLGQEYRRAGQMAYGKLTDSEGH